MPGSTVLAGMMVLAGATAPAGAAPGARHAPPPPTGELMLDLAHPVVTMTIAGVPMRLTVNLNARDTVELNPAAAARLPLRYETSGVIEVGRVTLTGRQARATGEIDGRPVALVVETHGVPCCADTDGEIGPEQLPYARVRFVRAGVAPAGQALRFPARVTPEAGLIGTARFGGEQIALKLAPDAPETIATGAAGAILAQAGGGRWDGPQRPLPLAFGVVRPVRPLRLGRRLRLMGLPIETLLVRTADFRGERALPGETNLLSDIVVKGRARPAQHEWLAVTIGRPQLDACTEIVAERVPEPVLELRCSGILE